MVKALARAFRWRKMLGERVHATTIEELARAKGVAPPNMPRVLRRTLLAREMVEAILDGRQPAGQRCSHWWIVVGSSRDWRQGRGV
jgi:hypothetical protein